MAKVLAGWPGGWAPLLRNVIGLGCAALAACGSHASPGLPPGSIEVDAAAPGAEIRGDQLGTNLGVWYDVTTPTLPRELAQLRAHLLRWPGGTGSDTYHWQFHTQCGKSRKGYASAPASSDKSTFDNFMSRVALPGDYHVAVTVAYGTDPTCQAGGQPAEAAAWVAHVRSSHWSSRVKYWTVGNEEYGDWEVDLHSKPHDAGSYARAMSGPDGYYALMKAADPNARVGVVVAGSRGNTWDGTVLSQAPYDFVELHYYPQQPGRESDSYLSRQAPADFIAAIAAVRSELAAAGRPGTPIMVGEVNSVAYNPGKQSVSMVSALYASQVLVAGIESRLAVDAWWFGDGDAQGCGHNTSWRLYGFQDWGSYDLVFGDSADQYNNCTSRDAGPIVPEGTLSPSGQSFRLVSEFARPGERLLYAASGSSDVRAFAATQGGGYALLLVNLSAGAARRMTVSLSHARVSRYIAADEVYGKEQYESSRGNVWLGPLRGKLGNVGARFELVLPPWSIMLVRLQPTSGSGG